MKTDSCRIISITLLGLAPNAFLMPNSLVLSFTTNTMMLDIPIIPAIKVPIATKITIASKTPAKSSFRFNSSATFLINIPL